MDLSHVHLYFRMGQGAIDVTLVAVFLRSYESSEAIQKIGRDCQLAQ